MYFIKEVCRVVDNLVKDRKAFTVFDITRILNYQFPHDVPLTLHEKVKAAVQDYFFTSNFDGYYTRRVGHQLNISPLNPQIYYHVDHSYSFDKYDRDALDPNPQPKPVQLDAKFDKGAGGFIIEPLKVTKLSVFAVKDKNSNLFWGKRNHSSPRRLVGFRHAQLYGNLATANQLKRNHPGSEVVEFKVLQQ